MISLEENSFKHIMVLQKKKNKEEYIYSVPDFEAK